MLHLKLNRENRIKPKMVTSRRLWKLNILALVMIFSLFATMAVTSAQSQNYTFEEKWGSLGEGNGQFNRPYDVAVDNLGNVYVADTYNDRIQKFTSDGTFLASWGTYGTGNGQFNYTWA